MTSNKNESEATSFAPSRQYLDVQVDSYLKSNEGVYRVEQLIDFETIIGRNVETGLVKPLKICDLKPLDNKMDSPFDDLDNISDIDWKIASKRYEAIKPLLNFNHIPKEIVERQSTLTKTSQATLYRWLNSYKSFGVLSSLIPKSRGWKSGKSRISKEAEKVIQEVISTFYLTIQRSSVSKAVTEVLRICHIRGIDAPGESAIRRRVNEISEKKLLRGRGQKEKGQNKFSPAAGKFPNADFPLAVVQIDHTPADIILVDDQYRKPVGRPWITLAMDVHTRMITGYYLSFDPPSETSVAMCVAHSILPKEEWLLLHKVEAEWPVWGIPKTIHVDNGADFRSNNFQQSCAMYGINLEFRPVKQPRYGGHIERILGTILKEIHDLPGTTFSNIKEKDNYNSEKEAVLTKSEFENWLVSFICKIYHKRLHSSIGMTPTRKWEVGIFGNADTVGVGVPARPVDRQTILLDFLPSFKRTVQAFGVTIDGMTYYAEALRPWINMKNASNPNQKQELIFRRDPRDISTIWFFDPTLKQYYKIPTADLSFPSVSVWEFTQAKESLKREGKSSVNEHQIFKAITELRLKVDESKQNTKKARRQAQRRVEHEKKISPATPMPSKPITPIVIPTLGTGLLSGDIDDFGDIE